MFVGLIWDVKGRLGVLNIYTLRESVLNESDNANSTLLFKSDKILLVQTLSFKFYNSH